MTSSMSVQNEPNLTLWWGCLQLSSGDASFVPQEKFTIMFWCFIPYDKSFIDQACSVKMAGYWPRSFLRAYEPRPRKNNLANIQPPSPHAWSITHTYRWNTGLKKLLHGLCILKSSAYIFQVCQVWQSSFCLAFLLPLCFTILSAIFFLF